MPELSVTTLDVAILIGYVVLTRLAFGWYFARKTKAQGAESYFLAGRELRWPIIGLSFYVANMSGGSTCNRSCRTWCRPSPRSSSSASSGGARTRRGR